MSSLTVSLLEQVSQWDTGLRAENLPKFQALHLHYLAKKIAMHGIVEFGQSKVQ